MPLPPFSETAQLNCSLETHQSIKPDFIPGHPRLRDLDTKNTLDFLASDLCLPDLDRIAPYLWLISTPSHQNVTPLHRQGLRRRKIIVMEDPGLHLVWIYDRIFVKPLPQYLLSYAFWTSVLLKDEKSHRQQRSKVVAAALGYLRTYFYLIRYQSDFDIAQRQDVQLVPKSVTWEQFCDFTAYFNAIDIQDVSPRYQKYGELRLTRLNLLVKLLFVKWTYCDVAGQYRDYFEQFYASFLFVFAVLSVLLNAMQVTLAVESLDPRPWQQFWELSRWFAISCMAVCLLLGGTLMLILVKKLSSEVLYATKAQAVDMIKRRASLLRTETA